MIEVGQVYKMKTGEIFRIETYSNEKFEALLFDPKTEKPTKFIMQGKGLKLPMFIKMNGGKRYKDLEDK